MKGIDPTQFLADLDSNKARIISAGGEVLSTEMLDRIIYGVHQEFYSSYIRDTLQSHGSNKVTPEVIATVREGLRSFHSNTPSVIRDRYISTAQTNFTQSTSQRTNPKPSQYKGSRVDTRECHRCGKVGHIAPSCNAPRNVAIQKCRRCQVIGHYASDCTASAPVAVATSASA